MENKILKNEKKYLGFTLIEFMIALSIMALLTGTILVGLNSSKMDARDDAAILAVNETVDKVLDCMDRNQAVGNTNPICSGGKDRTTLPNGWTYTTMTGISNPTSATYKQYNVRASFGSPATKTITCTNISNADGRCTHTGF